jgi:hypothetical protein
MFSPQLPTRRSARFDTGSLNAQWFLKAILFTMAISVLSGCGGGPALPPLHPVEGKVTVDDVPLSSGQVSFMPMTTAEGKSVPPSSGTIDSSGNYKIFTGGKAGAPAGKYKIAISPAMVPMEGAKGPPKTPFNEKYRELSKTPLQVDVPKTDGYDLKLTK